MRHRRAVRELEQTTGLCQVLEQMERSHDGRVPLDIRGRPAVEYDVPNIETIRGAPAHRLRNEVDAAAAQAAARAEFEERAVAAADIEYGVGLRAGVGHAVELPAAVRIQLQAVVSGSVPI